MITDLTQGSISKRLWLFSIPMLISVMFQQIYNIADSMIAGKFVGEDALAAVGASYPVTMLFMAVAMGCNIGCSVVISQYFGAKRLVRDENRCLHHAVLASGGLSAAADRAGGLLLSGPILRAIHTPSNIFADAALYLNIYIGGPRFPVFVQHLHRRVQLPGRFPHPAGISSSAPLWATLGWISSFVTVFDMGVAGVAWATFIAQGAACLLSLATLAPAAERASKRRRKAPASPWRCWAGSAASRCPASCSRASSRWATYVHPGPGQRLRLRPSSLATPPPSSSTPSPSPPSPPWSNGLSSFSAQNLGAGKIDRVRRGFWSGCLLAVCVVAPFTLVYGLFTDAAVRLFLDTTSRYALEIGCDFLRLVAPFYLVISVKLMADGILRGAGAMKSFMVATFTDLMLRVILAFLLSARLGTDGIWLSWPIGWTAAAVLSCAFYFAGRWKTRFLR